VLSGLLGAFTALLGALLVPLALGSGTAWLLIPAHLGFSVACAGGATLAGVRGRPWRARAYGLGFLAASLGAVVALAAGSEARDGAWYWILPWAVCLLWAWIPPIIALLAAWLGEARRAGRTRSVVRRRRSAAAIAAREGGSPR
jgi:hypothetical protein